MTGTRLFGLLLGALLASGCLREEGLPYDQLGIEALRSDGSRVARFPKCFTVPILHGSVVEERHTVESGVVIVIHATDSVIDLSFEGVIEPNRLARSILVEDLQAGIFDQVSLEGTSGAAFNVKLSTGCSTAQ